MLLNPYAEPFVPVYTEEHMLFLTFSNGFPLTRTQIYHFFNRMWAPYVEQVFVPERREGSGPSLFGRVMFKHHLIPGFIMGNHERVCFFVDGHHLYCRRFVRQRTTRGRGGGSHDGNDE